ncbi:MAG TPA: (d)CMP kinase [Tepidisphaeraceae bacterium]|nr:(d)CMP kinase [Tepidisphaeraceae bacterium]
MIITIDGPAGTGKSTVARKVAERLSFDFLDTGAMYRTIALEALRRKVSLTDARELAFVARHCRIGFDWSKRPPAVLLNGEPVSHLIRGSEVASAASFVAAVGAVRQRLVQEQQRIGAGHGNLVTEGRDQGTVVFPEARAKFYLDATPAERCRRRVAQLRARGEMVNSDEVLREIIERDKRDSTRAVGPLIVPPDAQVIDTTKLSEDEVVDRIVTRATSLMDAT